MLEAYRSNEAVKSMVNGSHKVSTEPRVGLVHIQKESDSLYMHPETRKKAMLYTPLEFEGKVGETKC